MDGVSDGKEMPQARLFTVRPAIIGGERPSGRGVPVDTVEIFIKFSAYGAISFNSPNLLS